MVDARGIIGKLHVRSDPQLYQIHLEWQIQKLDSFRFAALIHFLRVVFLALVGFDETTMGALRHLLQNGANSQLSDKRHISEEWESRTIETTLHRVEIDHRDVVVLALALPRETHVVSLVPRGSVQQQTARIN